MSGTMKAVRYHEQGKASVLQVENIPIPRPGAGEILVRLHAAGLNNVDAHIRGGMIPLPTPVIPGMDAAGVVEEVGAGAGGFQKGDRVIVFTRYFSPNGVYAQYYVARPDQLVRLPDNYSFEQGAALPTPFYAAYYNIAIIGRAKADDVVLINGAGGAVGLNGIEICKALGCKVIGVAGGKAGLELIAKKGAIAIDYKDPDLVKKLQEAAGLKGVIDIILETQGRNVPTDLVLAAPGGRILLIGNPSAENLNLGLLVMKGLSLHGTSVTNATQEQYEEMRSALEKALATKIIHPDIFKVFRLNDVVKAHEELETPSKGIAGKMILNLD